VIYCLLVVLYFYLPLTVNTDSQNHTHTHTPKVLSRVYTSATCCASVNAALSLNLNQKAYSSAVQTAHMIVHISDDWIGLSTIIVICNSALHSSSYNLPSYPPVIATRCVRRKKGMQRQVGLSTGRITYTYSYM